MLKGYSVVIKQQTQHLKRGATYGFALVAILFFSLLVWLLTPETTQAERSVVYLRNTLEPTPVATELQTSQVMSEPVVSVDPDQYLIDQLKVDDSQRTYDALEDKESWHVVRMRVTGYCACSRCCGKFSDGRTASNHRIRRGDVFVAADKRYRFGTEMMIPGYNSGKTVSVQDRGRVIKGNRLDLYFDTHQQAKKWGVKYLNVMVKNR